MQPFSITVHHGPFLLLVASGDGMACDATGMIDLAAAVVHGQGYERVMFDTLAASFHMTQEEADALGRHVAARLAGVLRVCSVVQARSKGGAGEKAAQAAGLNIRTFTDLKQAFDWMDEA